MNSCLDCGKEALPPFKRCGECQEKWQKDHETFCGIKPLVTGKHDPMWPRVCKPHDEEAEQVIAGEKVDALGMAIRHIGRSMKAGVEGAYMLVMAIPYAVIGAIGGLLRHRFIAPKPKQDPPSDEML